MLSQILTTSVEVSHTITIIYAPMDWELRSSRITLMKLLQTHECLNDLFSLNPLLEIF